MSNFIDEFKILRIQTIQYFLSIVIRGVLKYFPNAVISNSLILLFWQFYNNDRT